MSDQPQPQYFVHVQSTYAAKNKLCKDIIAALAPYDGTLFPSGDDVKLELNSVFHKCCLNYIQQGGKAALPIQSTYNFGKNKGFGFQVPDTITINAYQVNRIFNF